MSSTGSSGASGCGCVAEALQFKTGGAGRERFSLGQSYEAMAFVFPKLRRRGCLFAGADLGDKEVVAGLGFVVDDSDLPAAATQVGKLRSIESGKHGGADFPIGRDAEPDEFGPARDRDVNTDQFRCGERARQQDSRENCDNESVLFS